MRLDLFFAAFRAVARCGARLRSGPGRPCPMTHVDVAGIGDVFPRDLGRGLLILAVLAGARDASAQGWARRFVGAESPLALAQAPDGDVVLAGGGSRAWAAKLEGSDRVEWQVALSGLDVGG